MFAVLATFTFDAFGGVEATTTISESPPQAMEDNFVTNLFIIDRNIEVPLTLETIAVVDGVSFAVKSEDSDYIPDYYCDEGYYWFVYWEAFRESGTKRNLYIGNDAVGWKIKNHEFIFYAANDKIKETVYSIAWNHYPVPGNRFQKTKGLHPVPEIVLLC
jgi:hypothetical protein